MSTYSREKAVEIIYREFTPMDAVEVLSQKNWINAKVIQNKELLKNGKFPFNVVTTDQKKKKVINDLKSKKKSIAEICCGHETDNDGSTNYYYNPHTKIYYLRCFVGGCDLYHGLDVIGIWAYLKLGGHPKVLRTKAGKKLRNKAIDEIAAYLGLTVSSSNVKLTPQQKQENLKKRIIERVVKICREEYMVNPEFQEYFREKRAFKYGVVPIEELEEFAQIGCTIQPFPSTFYYDKLKSEFSTYELKMAGVIKQFENNKNAFDFFSEGMIMPYQDEPNLYGRALNPKEKKYRHLRLSGTTKFPIGWGEGHQYESVILGEGEFTWLSFIALGYRNALGSKGTNGFGEEEIRLMVKAREESEGLYCKTVYLCFDDDKAGIGATLTIGQMLLDNGFEVRVIRLNNGEDPNDILQNKKHNAKAYFDNLYENAITYHTFVALQTLKFKRRTVANKKRALQEVKEVLDKAQKLPEDELYLIAAEFSKEFEIPLDILWDTWRKKKNENVQVLDEYGHVFITKDLEGYILTKYKFPNTSYIEDTTFSFLKVRPQVQWLLADNQAYNEQEKKQLMYFAKNNGLKDVLFVDSFRTLIDTDVEEMLKKLFTQRLLDSKQNDNK